MRRIGSREFKNRLGRYLAVVRQGQSLLVTDRGQPVALVSPPGQEARPEESLSERLRELEAKGLIRLAKRPMKSFKGVASRGKSASQMLIEDRR
jgi:prevent-host-death family protein